MFSLSLNLGEKRSCLSFKNQKIKLLLSFFAIFIFCTTLLLSCSKSETKQSENALSAKLAENELSSVEERVRWFAFGNYSLQEFVQFDEFPKETFVPWTEATNVSGVALLDKPLFLINKLGFLSFDFENGTIKPKLQNFLEFSKFTAQDFFLTEEGLYFRSYKNLLFCELPSNLPASTFLYKYNPVTEQIYPAFSVQDLGLRGNAQCTHLQKYGNEYFLSFKTETSAKVDFDFFKISKINDLKTKKLVAISKARFQDSVVRENINLDKKYNDDKLKKMISYFAKEIFGEKPVIVNLDLNTSYGESKKLYSFSTSTQDADANTKLSKNEISAQANYNPACEHLQILLPNGELFSLWFSADNSPKLKKFELPQLPKGFSYTYFFTQAYREMTNRSKKLHRFIIAFWEEKDFFKVGKTGFVIVPAKGLEPLRGCPQ